MESEKVVGYLLLVTGIGVVLAGTLSIYLVFTGRQRPPQVFTIKTPGISLPAPEVNQLKLPEGMSLPEGFSLPKNLSPETKTEMTEIKILPDELVNSIVNMSVYFLLMMFITSSGVKIASLGIKMIKDVRVVVKEEKIKQDVQPK